MRMYLLTGAALFALAGSAYALEINEIRVDQTGTDNDEYFELVGVPGESLDGLFYIVLGDDSGDGSGDFGKRSGSVEAVVDLVGLSIPADGFFLAVEASFTLGGSPDLVSSFSFENGDNVSHLLVRDFTGALGDALDTDRDGTLDITPWSTVVDGISLIETPNPPAANADEWNYNFGGGIGPDGAFVPGHVFRTNDEGSAWGIGDFAIGLGVGPLDSPGTSNVPAPGAAALFGVAGLVGIRRRRA